MNDKRLFLIDGHALVYRAYYAFVKNPLINSKGQSTSAVFGFANYLVRLIEKYSCPYIAVVMDSSKPTFRHELYAQYKANREEMPDDLKAQMPLINKLIQALNITVIRKDGLEADDLIAVLTRKAVKESFDVFLVTKDKDLMQLIGPNVKMLAPDGSGTLMMLDVEDVKEKMGIGPEKIVDYLALIGDASDNIPGVPGVGPKTALKILEMAGTVDKVLDNPSILENEKLIAKIQQNRELLCISKTLATLKEDVDIEITLDGLLRKPFDLTQCVSLFRDLEFTSLIRHPLFGSAPKSSYTVSIISDAEQIQKLNSAIKEAGEMAIDIRCATDLARETEIIGISVAVDQNNAVYIPISHAQNSNLALTFVLTSLKEVLQSPKIRKIGYNLKFIYQLFKGQGIDLQGVYFDVMIAAYLIDSGKRAYDIDMLALEFLGQELNSLEKILGSGKNRIPFKELSAEDAAAYSGQIACVSFSLSEKQLLHLQKTGCDTLFFSIEMPLVTVLGEMEWHGIKIDVQFLKKLSDEYGCELHKLSESIYQLAGESLNLNSPKQIAEVLFGKLSLPGAKKTKGGAQSTSVDVLEKLAPDYPIVQKILDYREIQKLLSTYIDALPEQIFSASGRVHTSFNQTVAATGRLSSTNPNLQNIPVRTEMGKRIREAFIAADGNVLISADYSQIELRILAQLSKDPFLIQAFAEDRDIHALTASAIYKVFPEMVTPEMRRAAKTINFGLMYGMGPINLARQLGISFGEAKMFIDEYFLQFPSIKKYMESTIDGARQQGYTETLLGRRRFIPEINSANRNIREAAERTAINTPVQGTAADIIKIAMINIQKEISEICVEAEMILQVHDELVFEVPEADAERMKSWIIEKMSNAYPLMVPLRVDAGIGNNWRVAH
ncbi:MAG TPA: DNA polymerase I [Chitinispirillaceae bacterium]|nr:DNA polymerase I [Chitinispirillaceae bacterium]